MPFHSSGSSSQVLSFHCFERGRIFPFVIISSTLLLLLSAFIADSANAACVQPPSGMVSWWSGDNHARDLVGGNNGTLINGATYAPGMVSQAFSLDGVSARVSFPNFFPPNNITVDAWINLAGTSHTGGAASIWGVGNSGGLQASVLFVDATMTHLYWDISTTGADRYLWSGTFTFSPNQWYHVAITQPGGPTSQPTMYVNSAPLTVTNFMANGTPSHQNQPMAIGSYGGYTTQYFFEGLIDEVEVFNRVLSQSEIQGIYNAGSEGKCKVATAVPTMTEWGRIILTGLLGIGSVYYLRRRRLAI